MTRRRRFPSVIAPLALLVALLVALAAAAPAAGQSDEETVRKFRKFLGSWTYSTLIAKRALDNDDALPPPCGRRRVVGRRLVALAVRPEFIESREVPVKGEWVERVSVRRCGKVVHHNIFITAHKVRGLVARPGFPGSTRAGLDLQVAVGKAVLKRALAKRSGCRRVDVVDTRVNGRPRARFQPWTEVWTVWACGRRVQQTIGFTPSRAGRTQFDLQ